MEGRATRSGSVGSRLEYSTGVFSSQVNSLLLKADWGVGAAIATINILLSPLDFFAVSCRIP